MDSLLRPWRTTDVQSVTKYASNQKIAANLRDGFPYPYSEKDAQFFIRKCIDANNTNQLCYAIEMNGEAVGSIGIFVKDDVYRKTAELGYWLGEPFWGYGVMTHATKQICDEAFSRFDIVRIFAEPFSYNTGSAGFWKKPVSRLRAY